MGWHVAKASDIGGRAEQQDRTIALEKDEGKVGLMVMADGMGGHENGAMAAQIVIDMAENQFFDFNMDDPEDSLNDLIFQSHEAVQGIASESTNRPGATCVMLYVNNNEAYWAHVGDSRLYHLCGGQCVSVTSDHSVANVQKDAEHGHQLHMCLGGQNSIYPDFNATTMENGDVLYLCSDGFWSLVGPEDVNNILGNNIDLQSAVDQLVALACSRGDHDADNNSLLIARWQQDAQDQPEKGWLSRLFSG